MCYFFYFFYIGPVYTALLCVCLYIYNLSIYVILRHNTNIRKVEQERSGVV